jgi:hypothetical protein
MPYRNYSCEVCSGLRQISIVNEHNEVKEPNKDCPCCEGKGYLTVEYHSHSFNNNAWKRLMGEK